MDNETILFDRIQKINQIIKKYGEDNFYISFSGGKDSTVLSYLIDLAIPGNNIPRVYANTGIEYNEIIKFVKSKSINDSRFIIIKPKTPIKEMLINKGYPFKSKLHSYYVAIYQKYKTLENRPGLQHYLGVSNDGVDWSRKCPKKLKYQFTPECNIKISDLCCKELKEKPLVDWSKENAKPYTIIGIMREEGGRRRNANCLSFTGGKFTAFQPLAPIDKDWENWFIDKYNIEVCCLYNEPYNFDRTGCKGCPFAINLQHELDVLEKFFPNERKQCEYIWEPIYKEYRRLNYRLKEDSKNA